MSIQPPTTGLEYTIVPDGNVLGFTGGAGASGGKVAPSNLYPGSDTPYTFVSTDISYDSCVQITGYRINVKYVIVTTVIDPETNTSSFQYTYPNWNIIEQTLTCVSHTEPFQQETPLFTEPPGLVTTQAVAGITDGSCYDYFAIFDQGESGYLEPQGPYDSTPIEGEVVPTQPYDPANDIYPIDALTKFIPDSREQVTVSFQLYTKFTLEGSSTELEETATIFHVVTQSTDDWSAQVQGLVNKSYFYHGFTPLMPDPE